MAESQEHQHWLAMYQRMFMDDEKDAFGGSYGFWLSGTYL
jgi:hypothetical protein